MPLNVTYANQITVDTVVHLCNVQTCIISSLGPQGLVDMNSENGHQPLILEYYAEGQGDYCIPFQSVQKQRTMEKILKWKAHLTIRKTYEHMSR